MHGADTERAVRPHAVTRRTRAAHARHTPRTQRQQRIRRRRRRQPVVDRVFSLDSDMRIEHRARQDYRMVRDGISGGHHCAVHWLCQPTPGPSHCEQANRRPAQQRSSVHHWGVTDRKGYIMKKYFCKFSTDLYDVFALKVWLHGLIWQVGGGGEGDGQGDAGWWILDGNNIILHNLL